MKWIRLTQGMRALVDDEDYPGLAVFKWHARFDKVTKKWYALRELPMVNGKRGGKMPMHRQILGLEPGDPREGDHIKTKRTLDNRRSNLRIATHAQNGCNIEMRKHNTSGLRGIYKHPLVDRWVAQISVNGKKTYLGIFKTKRQAHNRYKEAAKQYHGEFARAA
jgi:hypothetical protein